jgi:DNA-binding CsgD family transcriptional regulator
MPTLVRQDIHKLGTEMLQFAGCVENFATPKDVLEGLDEAASYVGPLNVLGAALLPVRCGDWGNVEKGKTAFLHKSVPVAWWDEHIELTRKHPGPAVTFARMSLAPFTLSELMRILEPLGIDRWPVELALRYGMRDCLTCPVGGRWIVVYWSPQVLSRLTPEQRALLFLGASFAAIQLQKIIEPVPSRLGRGACLTPRELAVLRLLAEGKRVAETADLLGLGQETVRSHLKKAQVKLGVHDRTHAVVQAMRQHLIT